MRRVVGVRTSPCGRRAQAIRLYCGYSEIKKFCEEFLDGEASPARWGHVERGVIPFSFGLIGILKTKIPAIDTEWLRAGAEDKMPVGLLRDLKKILDDPAQFWAVQSQALAVELVTASAPNRIAAQGQSSPRRFAAGEPAADDVDRFALHRANLRLHVKEDKYGAEDFGTHRIANSFSQRRRWP